MMVKYSHGLHKGAADGKGSVDNMTRPLQTDTDWQSLQNPDVFTTLSVQRDGIELQQHK